MFGLEKQPKGPFEFDLEKDLKKDPNLAKNMLKMIDGKIGEIKEILRKGGTTQDMDECGTILQAYVSTKKVIERSLRKNKNI